MDKRISYLVETFVHSHLYSVTIKETRVEKDARFEAIMEEQRKLLANLTEQITLSDLHNQSGFDALKLMMEALSAK